MAGKLVEPKVIIDFNNNPVAMLPIGFYFDDERWDAIWAEYDLKGSSLTMDDLKRMFPDDESLKARSVKRTGSQLGEDFK
ncbi:MAG: hypothetical protein DIZ80_08790 [endosymbiont of Galathealinum brachiosum]|uniref:Uncharacterized protein n=1 Tax=endosymbiont of Galathealinum brachiosum TaxID=2200906 RepID=A0A370DBU5_9GAMM|nr:MAG: hypothetical protein DIZ80_08790 [endosymbiont of Galathealinum brachiosum]